MGTDRGVTIRAEWRIVPSPPMLRINSVPATLGFALFSSQAEHRHEETP